MQGAAVTLGSSGKQYGPTLALAGDGQFDIVCWDSSDMTGMTSVSCASAPAASGASTAGATILGGSLPALALGDGGFALVYAASDGAEVQALDSTAKPSGTPSSIASKTPVALAIAARATGYAAIIGGSSLVMHPLGKNLSAMAKDFTLQASFQATLVAAAASGDAVIAVWGDSSQVSSVTLAANGTLHAPVSVSPDHIYSQVSACAGNGSFAATWSSQVGHIGYRAFDVSGMVVGAEQTMTRVNWDDNPHAIIGVADGFLLATTVESTFSSIVVSHLGCP